MVRFKARVRDGDCERLVIFLVQQLGQLSSSTFRIITVGMSGTFATCANRRVLVYNGHVEVPGPGIRALKDSNEALKSLIILSGIKEIKERVGDSKNFLYLWEIAMSALISPTWHFMTQV